MKLKNVQYTAMWLQHYACRKEEGSRQFRQRRRSSSLAGIEKNGNQWGAICLYAEKLVLMRKFDYSFLNNRMLPANLENLTANLEEIAHR